MKIDSTTGKRWPTPERERERQRQTDRERERDRGREIVLQRCRSVFVYFAWAGIFVVSFFNPIYLTLDCRCLATVSLYSMAIVLQYVFCLMTVMDNSSYPNASYA